MISRGYLPERAILLRKEAEKNNKILQKRFLYYQWVRSIKSTKKALIIPSTSMTYSILDLTYTARWVIIPILNERQPTGGT